VTSVAARAGSGPKAKLRATVEAARTRNNERRRCTVATSSGKTKVPDRC